MLLSIDNNYNELPLVSYEDTPQSGVLLAPIATILMDAGVAQTSVAIKSSTGNAAAISVPINAYRIIVIFYNAYNTELAPVCTGR